MVRLTFDDLRSRVMDLPIPKAARVYGVPRGGVYAALILQVQRPDVRLVEKEEDCDVVLDDIVDSGRTRNRYGARPFYALVDKQGADHQWSREWVSFPWERMVGDSGVEGNVERLIQFIGDDPSREGLRETPARVARSYQELFSGYKADPSSLLKTFEDGVCDEMVVLRDIEFVSFCEHHMLPFYGGAHIGYLPKGKIVGVSKLARLLEAFSRRLQVQERLTTQITAAMDEYLKPLGSACVIEARHSCMSCRGVNKQQSTMITSSLTGVFRQGEVRGEFLRLIGK